VVEQPGSSKPVNIPTQPRSTPHATEKGLITGQNGFLNLCVLSDGEVEMTSRISDTAVNRPIVEME